MNKTHIQFAGLVALSLLAAALLYLVGYTTHVAVSHITNDGKVPVLDAGQVTAYLLAFQQVVNTMRSIWESQERSSLAEGLSNSTPNAPAPQSAIEGARDAADAAASRAAQIEGQG